MGLYLFQHPKTGEVKEVFQNMNDVHEYSEKGVKWNRIFTAPNAAIDTKWDENSSADFAEKTKNKKGTYGDLIDKSAELSQIRAEKCGGKDPIKEKYYENYSKKRKGKRSLHQIKEAMNREIVIK